MENKKTKVFVIHNNSSQQDPESVSNQSKIRNHYDVIKNSIINKFHYRNERKVSNKQPSENQKDGTQIRNVCFGLLALIIPIMASFPITMIPTQNVVLYPEYWYETMISIIPSHFLTAICVVVGARMLFDCVEKNMMKMIADISFSLTITWVMSMCLFHFIWTTILGYIEPVPFKCLLPIWTQGAVLLCRVWHVFPKTKNMDATFHKRKRAFMCSLLWIYVIGYQMLGMNKIFKILPLEFQWIAGFTLFFIKEMNDRIYAKILVNTATAENVCEVQVFGKISITLAFSFWTAVFLATTATEATGYVMLGINSVVNLALCSKIMRLKRKTFTCDIDAKINQMQIRNSIMELVANEAIELVVPISFIGAYIIAYYGPNYDIIGSVGCSYWTFNKVEDIAAFLKPILKMAIIDCGSGLISGILLLRFCQINIIDEYSCMIEKYWMLMAISGASCMNKVIFSLIEM